MEQFYLFFGFRKSSRLIFDQARALCAPGGPVFDLSGWLAGAHGTSMPSSLTPRNVTGVGAARAWCVWSSSIYFLASENHPSRYLIRRPHSALQEGRFLTCQAGWWGRTARVCPLHSRHFMSRASAQRSRGVSGAVLSIFWLQIIIQANI